MQRIIFSALLLLFPHISMAIGIGVINVKSSLGEPLVASAHLSLEYGDTLSSSAIRIASPGEYVANNVHYEGVVADINSVTLVHKGRYIIEITSVVPVLFPVVHLLLRYNGSDHSLHYKLVDLILDPAVDDHHIDGDARPRIHYGHDSK